MAHPNIVERQTKVNKLLKRGKMTHSEIKKLLSLEFNCTKSAIHADILQYITRNVTVTIYQSKRLRQEVHKRDEGMCQYCGTTDANCYDVEHIIPAFHGGVARLYNLVLACHKCNTTKRREVWIPRNFDDVTTGHPEWGQKILSLSVKDFRLINE